MSYWSCPICSNFGKATKKKKQSCGCKCSSRESPAGCTHAPITTVACKGQTHYNSMKHPSWLQQLQVYKSHNTNSLQWFDVHVYVFMTCSIFLFSVAPQSSLSTLLWLGFVFLNRHHFHTRSFFFANESTLGGCMVFGPLQPPYVAILIAACTSKPASVC